MIFYAITLCFIMFICPFVGPLIWTNKILSYFILYSVFPNFICNCREESIELFRNFTCIIYNFIVFTFVMLNVMNDALEDLSFSNSSNKDKSPNTSVAILDRKFKDCLGVFGTLPNSPCQQRCICTGGAKNVNFWKTVKPFFSKKCNSGDQK
jgi:hypothetical protein